jgi:putative SOS response-associated peptidase YedK
VRTFSIVTTRPNEQMAGLHDRMPVVLPESAWDLWLDPELGDPGELQGLFEPTDEVGLRIEPVADLVNNVRNDGPELIRPIDPAELARATAGPPGLFDEVNR